MSGRQHTDIALITLSKAVKYKTNIRPICLDSGVSRGAAGQMVTVAGWGSLREGELPRTGVTQLGRSLSRYGELLASRSTRKQLCVVSCGRFTNSEPT